MEANNALFSTVILEVFPPFAVSGPWQWCFRENSTYLDCPIGAKNGSDGMVDMVVAAYNPSTDPTNYTVIAVPHGHYTVYAYNSTSAKTFVNASVLCDEEVVEKAVINNCQMYVDYPIPGL